MRDISVNAEKRTDAVGTAIIEEVTNIHEKIIFLKKEIEGQFVKLGAYLSLVNENKLYKERGYDTFEAYIAQPELAMERRTVFAIMGVWRDFFQDDKKCNQLHLESMIEIGYSKLDRIRQFKGRDDFDEWIEKARTLSLSDLNAEIREIKGEPVREYAGSSRLVTITCPYCNKTYEYKIVI